MVVAFSQRLSKSTKEANFEQQVEARVKVEHKGREARKSWLNLSLNLISVGR